VREGESLLGLLIAALFFLLWWIYGTMSLAVFALPITFFIVFVPSLGYERYIFPSSGVRISWLIAHISALLAAYTALGFSMLASVLYLVQERRIKSKHKPGEDSWWVPLEWLPPLDTLERIAHATLLFGFPCMTVGLVIGSVLAQETVLGAAYFRDPKVIASFVMWAVYVLLLFLRSTKGLRGRRAAYLSGAVFLVMLAVWAANLLSHVHRYGAS
jgi:ABC-type transport system involved in cytochrome c biogenesis permease subunit